MMEYFKPVTIPGPQEGPEDSLEQSKTVLKSEDKEQILGRKIIGTSTESGFLSSSASREEKTKLKNVKQIYFAPPQNAPNVEDDDEDMEKEVNQPPRKLDLISKCNLN